jgi:hypothetical protein
MEEKLTYDNPFFSSEYDLIDVNDFYLKFLCKVTIWIIPQSIL